MQSKTTVNILAIAVFIGFCKGLIESISTVVSNDYFPYRMFRLVFLIVQDNCNTSIFRWILGLFVVTLVWFVFVEKLKFDRNKVLVTLLVIWSTSILIRIFARRTLVSLTKQIFSEFHKFITSEDPFSVFVSKTVQYTYVIPIVFAGIITILLLYWLFKRADFSRMFTVFDSSFIRKSGLLFALSTCILNAATRIDSKMNVPEGPNVVFIVIDTLRADHLGCYGYFRNISPHIDELSRDSYVFMNAISSAPWTSPSIGSMITAQYPGVMGFEDSAIKVGKNFLTLAEIFRDNGYHTKGIISHTYISGTLGFNQGFSSYDEKNARGHDYISSPSVTYKAISYLRKQGDSRFFLFLHYFDPHYDYIQHGSYNYYPDYQGSLHSMQSIRELRDLSETMTEDDAAYLNALYDSEISFTDDYVGEVIEELKKLDLYENTIIVFTADHGEEFLERGDHWIGHTRTLYQELIHVPLMIKLSAPGRSDIIEENVGLIDLMPTIIELAGLEIPHQYDYDGKAINLNDRDQREDRIIISETRRLSTLQSIIRGDWKLIYDEQSSSSKLFDLREDPGESMDVTVEHGDVSNEMKQLHDEWSKYVQLKKSGIVVEQPEFTPEQIEYLRTLGYIE